MNTVPPPSRIRELGRRAVSMLDALASITAEPGRITRLYLTPEHRKAADLVAEWMRELGLEVSEDALATVKGRMAPTVPGGSNRRLVIGSHIDTVIDAGKYDGCLGVVAGLIVAEEIVARGIEVPFGLEIVAFGDEEGVRFPTTLSSSKALAGTLKIEELDRPGIDGLTMRQALVAFGKEPLEIPLAAADPDSLLGYVELHIEQGPVLEHENTQLGVVSSIAGQSRFRIVIDGEAGHAGTVPMDLRRDALMAAAEFALICEATARDHVAAAMVATVGRLEVRPGASNVIPARVVLSLDLRAASDPPRMEAIETIRRSAEGIAGRRGVSIEFLPVLDQPTTLMSGRFRGHLGLAIDDIGVSPRVLPSGAGHDAMAMAEVTPSAMLFVRSRGGISHNPAEYTDPDDIGLAIEALLRFVVRLAREEGA